MTDKLNGVNLEEPGKWGSFVIDWPRLAGWCDPDYRAELVEAVTGMALTIPAASTPLLVPGTGVRPRAQFLHDDDRLYITGPLAFTPPPETALRDGVEKPVPPEYIWRLVSGDQLRLACGPGTLHWDDEGGFEWTFVGCACHHIGGDWEPLPVELATVVDSGAVQGFGGDEDIVVLDVTGTDRAVYAAVLTGTGNAPTPTWYPDFVNDGTPGTGYALTEIERATGSSCDAILYRLVNPVASSVATSSLRVNAGGSMFGGTIAYAWALSGVDQTTPELDTATNSGTGSGSSLSLSEPGLVLEVSGWGGVNNATMSTPINTGDNTTDYANTINLSFGLPDWAAGFAHGSDTAPTWSFTDSHPWAAAAVTVQAS
jgi:hypothetical protein